MGIRGRLVEALRTLRVGLDGGPPSDPAPDLPPSAPPAAPPLPASSPALDDDPLDAEEVLLDPDRLVWLMEVDDVLVVDLRDGPARVVGAIPGSVPQGALEASDVDRLVVLVDEDGARAPATALAWRARGAEAWALRGGMAGWRRAGHALTPDGAVA